MSAQPTSLAIALKNADATLPTVRGTPLSGGLMTSKPTWWASIFEEARGPFTPGDVLGLIEEGVIHAESLMWRDPWPHWNRVCESDELGWAWERALLCEIETPSFDIDVDLEVPFIDPPGWENLDAETREILAPIAHMRKAAPVSTRDMRATYARRQPVASFGSIVALGLALAAGSAAWASQIPML